MEKIALTLFNCAAAARPEGPLPIMAIFFPVRRAGICKCNLFSVLIPEVDIAGSSLKDWRASRDWNSRAFQFWSSLMAPSSLDYVYGWFANLGMWQTENYNEEFSKAEKQLTSEQKEWG